MMDRANLPLHWQYSFPSPEKTNIPAKEDRLLHSIRELNNKIKVQNKTLARKKTFSRQDKKSLSGEVQEIVRVLHLLNNLINELKN